MTMSSCGERSGGGTINHSQLIVLFFQYNVCHGCLSITLDQNGLVIAKFRQALLAVKGVTQGLSRCVFMHMEICIEICIAEWPSYTAGPDP